MPTPSRREAEAARRERLNPTLAPKAARAREREARVAARNARLAKIEGEPRKVLLRDFVDSRNRISGWSMPLLAVTLAFSLFFTTRNTELALAVTFFTYALFAILGIDLYLSWRGFKALAAQRLPGVSLKGMPGYLISRAVNVRRLRTPPPRVKIGDPI